VLRSGAIHLFALVHCRLGCRDLQIANPRQRVCGKPRSTCDVAGSGQRDVTTFERV
jgi:hypothetical protein